MPCYDSRNEPSYVRAEAKKEFQARLDKLTRLLCEAGKVYSGVCSYPSRELEAWWRDHAKLDRERVTKVRRNLKARSVRRGTR